MCGEAFALRAAPGGRSKKAQTVWEKPIALTFNVGKARQEEKQVGREMDLGDRRTVSHLTPVADLIRKGFPPHQGGWCVCQQYSERSMSGDFRTKVDGVCVSTIQ